MSVNPGGQAGAVQLFGDSYIFVEILHDVTTVAGEVTPAKGQAERQSEPIQSVGACKIPPTPNAPVLYWVVPLTFIGSGVLPPGGAVDGSENTARTWERVMARRRRPMIREKNSKRKIVCFAYVMNRIENIE